jgi:hypothetical protein
VFIGKLEISAVFMIFVAVNDENVLGVNDAIKGKQKILIVTKTMQTPTVFLARNVVAYLTPGPGSSSILLLTSSINQYKKS